MTTRRSPNVAEFYLSLIEFLQQRLDLLSLEEGRLVQTYEIFDLTGVGRSVSRSNNR